MRGDHDGRGRPWWPARDLAGRGSERVIFHTDRGCTYTANDFTELCRKLGIRQSMGRVGSCFDNAAAEAFFSSLEWEVLSRHGFRELIQAQAVVLDWCYGFYNHQRRHSAADGLSPVNYENRDPRPGSRIGNPPRFRGNHNSSTSSMVRRTYRTVRLWYYESCFTRHGLSGAH